ncbi:DUF6090 family protein [Salinimicrobium soli]|uniref:DUF6090 family protein n=1 Tax=Salinimicrobium soli TaxID=1254399 RepID=UPI003AAA2083
MISFFRIFHRDLLGRGKIRKYLLYAAGEIVLVVIGILIALQINNWNERRKLQKTEVNSLMELKAALEISRDNLHHLLENNERWQTYNLRIKDYMENRKPYDTTLDVCFGTYYWTGKAQFTTAAYTKLKNNGLELISNKALRKDLVYVFEDYFGQVKNEHEQWDTDFLAYVIYPHHVQLFEKYYPPNPHPQYDEYAKPTDYEALLENEEFHNIIAENISLRRYSMTFKKELLNKIDSLSFRIDEEIRSLSP